MQTYGGIEAGGTKVICAVGTGPDDIIAEARFATTDPATTLAQAIAFFREQHAITPLTALGVAAFGPLDPDPASPEYGYITTTPKPGWAQTDVVGPLCAEFGLPVGFDTDVNGAALGEHRWGGGQGLDTFVYLTIGTGLGGGGMVNGELIHGLMHAEMGHMLVPHDWDADPYPGFCPYHGDCWEGLAAGPAIEDRWGFRGEQLPPGHPSWMLEAHYLALGIVNIVTVLSPQRIILGGGVMDQVHLFEKVRDKVKLLLNGYIQRPQLIEQIDQFIVPPTLGNRAGVLGAIALAQKAATANGAS